MAFSTKKLVATDINGGNEFTNGQGLAPNDINSIVKGVLWLNENGGSGGGTTVEANPSGTATSILNKIKIDKTIYSIPQGSGGSSDNLKIYYHIVEAKIEEGYEEQFIFYSTTSAKIVIYDEDQEEFFIPRSNYFSIIGNVKFQDDGDVLSELEAEDGIYTIVPSRKLVSWDYSVYGV